ncbi:hypothetical protein LCGC14_1012980 [marine sediment metagenome]|uniref:DUF2441 domain-containing protein n=1 Tax=marine sediment metagenome TaxID=412755 RepID=A0A0F9MZT7_9ZZZZ
MFIVKNKNFYHIQKFNCPYKWKVGDKIFIGFENNHYANNFNLARFNYKIKTGEVVQILQSFQQIKSLINKASISRSDLNKIEELSGILNNFAQDNLKIHRENIFEEIRLKFFPNLPSRKRGIWLIPFNKESLKYWLGRIPKGKIFHIRATGKVHNSSENFLLIDHYISLNFIRQVAFSYWAGVNTESLNDEIIFEGFIEVIGEISS